MNFAKLALVCLVAIATSACENAVGYVGSAALTHLDSEQKLHEKQVSLYKSATETKSVMYDGKKVDVLSAVTKRDGDADVLTQCDIKIENGLRVTVDSNSDRIAPVL